MNFTLSDCPSMIDTSNYIRFERVDSFERIEHGLLARLHGEQLRIDVVGDDVVRVKISRGGVVRRVADVRGLRRPARRAGRRSRSSASDERRPAPHAGAWWCRCGSSRSASTCTAPTAAPSSRPRRRGRPLLGLRDAQRRLHDPPALPAGGRDLRTRREERPPEPQGPRLHALEHRRPRPGRRPRSSPPAGRPTTRVPTARASSSTRTTSRSRSSTTRPHPAGSMAGSFVDNGYRGALRLLRPRRVPRSTSPAASTPSTSSPGPAMPDILDGLHAGSPGAPRCRRCGRSATTSAAGSTTPRTRSRRSAQRHREREHPLRRAVARHRVHGRLPRLHLEHRGASPTCRACSRGWPSRASGSSRSSTPA